MADSIPGILKRLARLAPLVEKRLKDELSRQMYIRTEAAKLTSSLKEVQMVLEEAERRRLTDPRVRAWLEKLGSITYEIDDTLDEFDSKKLYLMMEDNRQSDDDSDDDDDDDDDFPKTVLEKISTFVRYTWSCIGRVAQRRNTALKIGDLNKRVEDLATKKIKYDMLPVSREFDGDDLIKTEINTAFAEFDDLRSQNLVKEMLIEDLKSELRRNDGPTPIPVISIVGMAGIGKTTLARLVYDAADDEEIFPEKFEIKSWICVSNFFDEIRVAKAILESAGGENTFQHISEFQALLEKIKSVVSNKKIFLMLDDVWIKDNHKWKQIRASLKGAAIPGSVILITTRNETAARLMGSIGQEQTKRVEVISEEDCGSILKKIVFDDRLSDMKQDLAKKCSGLPLAAKTLGDHLLSVRRRELIRDVLEQEFWEMEEVAKPIFASISFSYYELPLEVRRCFLLCGTISKELLGNATGSYITVGDIINICGILGYLNLNRTELKKLKKPMSRKERKEEMKLKGKAYFDKLHNCSLLQIYKPTETADDCCRMHASLHDFARYLLKTSSSKEENRCGFLTRNLVLDDYVRYKSAGVLYVTGSSVTQLEKEIKDMIHLRFLCLRETCITELPENICDLYNLQTLDLSLCRMLSKFPKGFSKLRNLKQLMLRGNDNLDKGGIEKLTWLQSLGDEYLVTSGIDLARLERLNRLEGSLTIIIITALLDSGDVENAMKAKLVMKKRVTLLKLVYNEGVIDGVKQCLEGLQAPPNAEVESSIQLNPPEPSQAQAPPNAEVESSPQLDPPEPSQVL